MVNSILSVPASSDSTRSGEEISSTAGTVTVTHCLIQPNGQWLDHMVSGVDLGPGCVFTSPGFVRNASKGLLCLGLDDSGSFWAFTNLVRLADTRNQKVYLALDRVQSWELMQSDLQKAILGGHDIVCHTMSHCLLGESNAISIQYTGSAASASITLSKPWLTVEIDGTNCAQLFLSDTISKVATALRTLPEITASLCATLEPGTPASYLENVSAVNIKIPAILKWDMPLKWTNEVLAWQAQIGTIFTNAHGSPYLSRLVAYPSGSYNEPLISKLQEFGFHGGRTVDPSPKRLRHFDMFRIPQGPWFKGQTAKLRFERNVADEHRFNDFTAANLGYSRDAYEGNYSGTFNGSNTFVSAIAGPYWDFSLGDWHVAMAVKLAGTAGERTLFSHGSDAANYMRLAIATDGSVFVSVYESGAECLRLSTPAAILTPDSRWHRVSLRETFGVWRICIDGVVRAETLSAVRCKAYTGNVLIGCETNWNGGYQTNWFHGQLDDFSQSRHAYMNTQAALDTAAEAGFVYMTYNHGYFIAAETYEIILDAVAEYPGGSASMMAPSAAIEQILSGSMVVFNRWVTLTNIGPADYRLTARSKAISAGDPSVLVSLPNLEDLNGIPITDAQGNLLLRTALSLGAYQPEPMLRATARNGKVAISWSTNLVSWELYSTEDLTPPVTWLPCLVMPQCQGAEWVVELPLQTSGGKFFRLQSR